jgi:hypothetical protein
MVGHEMRMRPIAPCRLQKGDAFLVSVGGLHDVRHGVRGPGVARIAGKRLAAEVLCALEIAGFLEAEGVKPEHKAR